MTVDDGNYYIRFSYRRVNVGLWQNQIKELRERGLKVGDVVTPIGKRPGKFKLINGQLVGKAYPPDGIGEDPGWWLLGPTHWLNSRAVRLVLSCEGLQLTRDYLNVHCVRVIELKPLLVKVELVDPPKESSFRQMKLYRGKEIPCGVPKSDKLYAKLRQESNDGTDQH